MYKPESIPPSSPYEPQWCGIEDIRTHECTDLHPIKLLGWDDLRDRGIKDFKANHLPQNQIRESFPKPDLSRQIPGLARARNRRAPSVADRSA